MNSDLVPRILRNIEDNHAERHYIFEDFDPRVEITDAPERYILLVHVPGFSRENVRAEIDNRGVLVMRGERRFQRRGLVGWTWQGMGDVCQRLKKAIMLPDNVELDGIGARVQNGILYIFLPKLGPGEFTWIEVGEEEEPCSVGNGIMIEDAHDDEGEPATPIVDISEIPGSSNILQNPTEEDEEPRSQSPIFPPTPSPRRESQEEPQTIFLPKLEVTEPETLPSPLPEPPSSPSALQESPHPIGVSSPIIPSSPIVSPPPTPSSPALQESSHPIDVSPHIPSSPIMSLPPTPSSPPPLQESSHPVDVSSPTSSSPVVSPPPIPLPPPPLQESPHPIEVSRPIPSTPTACPPPIPISLPPLAVPETPASPHVSPLPITELRLSPSLSPSSPPMPVSPPPPRPRTLSPSHSPVAVPQPPLPPLTLPSSSPPMPPQSPTPPPQSSILPPTPIPIPSLPIPQAVEHPLPSPSASSPPTPPQSPLPLPKSPQDSPPSPTPLLLPEPPSPILPFPLNTKAEIQESELTCEKEVASAQETELSSEEEEEAEEEGSVRSGPSPLILKLLIPIGVCVVACVVAYSMRRHRTHKHQKH